MSHNGQSEIDPICIGNDHITGRREGRGEGRGRSIDCLSSPVELLRAVRGERYPWETVTYLCISQLRRFGDLPSGFLLPLQICCVTVSLNPAMVVSNSVDVSVLFPPCALLSICIVKSS